jgi:cyclopropane fatty-acyl-phospholipid synthase-like methyltransferase
VNSEPPIVVAKYLEAVRAYYEPLVARHPPDTAGRVGWSSEHTQTRRFERLMAMTDLTRGDSLLDLGCGTGDLVAFLGAWQAPARYLGIDLMSDNVRQAQNRFASVEWASFQLGHPWIVIPQIDVVIASGLFALPSPCWHEVVHATLRRMLEIAGRTVVVNFLRASSLNESDATTRRSHPHEIMDLLERLRAARSLHLDTDDPGGDIVARIDAI